VVGPRNEILEVQNAIAIYGELEKLDPLSMEDFLKSHGKLMADLTKKAGRFRSKGGGVHNRMEVVHMAPRPSRVPALMRDLFDFQVSDRETPWILKACIFHYELEFIHPFDDGNGRMGRLWQQLLLMKDDPIFQLISVEAMIRNNQTLYYETLSRCDKKGDSTEFVEFGLRQILKAISCLASQAGSPKKDPESRLRYASLRVSSTWFFRKQYLDVCDDISSSTASKDLELGVKQGVLTKKGSANQVRYRFS
jgi:Fic family protein